MGEPRSSEDSASEPGSATNLPGLSELRDAVANRLLPRLPGFAALRRDGLAGLSSAVSNVPDGMANGVLVGVNPVYGLYATMMGPTVGGLLSGTQLMLITTTTTAAASLSTSQALGGLQGSERAEALFVLVMLAGAFQILFGLLGLGSHELAGLRRQLTAAWEFDGLVHRRGDPSLGGPSRARPEVVTPGTQSSPPRRP